MTLHTYIQSWKFAYLFSSSVEKIKFTCQKVRCVSSNNNREEQKKIPFSTTAAHRFIDNVCGVSTFDQCIFESVWHLLFLDQMILYFPLPDMKSAPLTIGSNHTKKVVKKFFQKYFFKTTFHHFFKPKILIFDTYSILST